MKNWTDFRVGDRVISSLGGWVGVQKGDTGTVIVVFDEANIGVEWDRLVFGHTCDMKGQPGHCTYEIPDALEIISHADETVLTAANFADII